MKIIVLGSTGMLGSAVGKYFLESAGEENVILSYKQKGVSYGKYTFHFDALLGYDYLVDTLDFVSSGDYVINCIGIIKPVITPANTCLAILINSLFPRKLAVFCAERQAKLIHITTDCVFSGVEGSYDEGAPHDCTDVYGKTKSLGEPLKCMCLRTSIIGEEIHNKISLVEWAKSRRGKKVRGYVNHYWNGITTKQYAKVCEKVMKGNLYGWGTYHVFSPKCVNKYELLHMINDRFDLQLEIERYEASPAVDRTLSTIKKLNSRLEIPSIEKQIQEM